MSLAPGSLLDLQAYWVSQGGVSLGIVGNAVHCKGYHLGKDRIYGSCACRPKNICVPGLADRDYSVMTARDKRGLSNAASAIDLGRLGGSLRNLYKFSEWLVEQCQANADGTSDLREVIYSPDGTSVLRWDRERGYWSAPRPGEADASHLTHTHLSYYRDSENRDKRPLFARFFEEGPMPGDYVIYPERRTGTVKAGTEFFNDWALTLRRGKFSKEATVTVDGYRAQSYAIAVNTGQGWADGKLRPTRVFVAQANITGLTVAPPADEKHRITLSIDDKPAYTTEV